LVSIIEQLCKSGHEVHILQKYTGGNLPSIPVILDEYSVTTDIIPFEAASKGNFAARYLKELKYVKSCKHYLSGEYDAVFIQSNTVAGFAVKEARKILPNAIVTFNVQDIFPYNAVYSRRLKKSLLSKALARIQRTGYKYSDHIITISEDMKNTLVKDGIDEKKIEVVYNWSYQDEPYESVDLTPVKHMFDSQYFNVVYAGNIGVMQNVDVIVDTANQMKNDEDICFHIIGNGVYKKRLEEQAKNYGIKNIVFWPMQPSALAPMIYSGADVNVIPLVKDVYKTALPSKTATCLACEKPIIFAIGTESCFGKMMAKQPGCVVVDCDNVDDLSKAIRSFKESSEKRYVREIFGLRFNRTKNSKRYVDIITGGR